jgi:ribosomal protein S18 acetylase RimI-like enzyme
VTGVAEAFDIQYSLFNIRYSFFSFPMDSVIRFEELSNNAWPALQTMLYDGWVLRFANGVTKRSNSVSLLYPSALDPDEKIAFCENLYEAQGITPCFKITGISEPAGIDSRLDRAGYFIHSHISFQTVRIPEIAYSRNTEITLHTELTSDWMDNFIRMNAFDASRKPTYTAIMNQLILPKCLVSLEREGQTVGVGLGVLEGDFVGIFDIVVDPGFRNRGLGRMIVENILQWGRNNGAHVAYLQVLTDNAPAIALYQRIGFRESYTYWYRMKK